MKNDARLRQQAVRVGVRAVSGIEIVSSATLAIVFSKRR
jgi:hypothetical protein